MTSSERTTSCGICAGGCEIVAAKNGHDIARCRACGFLFTDPYPSPEEVAAYYASHYREATRDFYPKAGSRKRRAWLRALKFLQYARPGRSVIDLGCGGGFMVEAFRRQGADAHGMDISQNSIAYARAQFPKASFHCASFETMTGRGLSFDFIFSSELMEHIAGTRAVMETMVALSKPGCVVYVASPDAGHPAVPQELTAWSDICPPEHLQWFNQRNMTLLFENHGFRHLKTRPKKSPALSMLFVREE